MICLEVPNEILFHEPAQQVDEQEDLGDLRIYFEVVEQEDSNM